MKPRQDAGVSAALDRWSAESDEHIVRHVIAGQTALFEVLMRRHNERLYRTARAILRDDREAEDIVQQAFVNAYTHLAQFGGRAKFSTWLIRIAVHEALAQARRQGRHQALNSAEHSVSQPVRTMPDPEKQAFARELAALLESAIDLLPDGAREVFMLRQVEGMSTAEVAEALDLSEDVVKARFSRARARLRLDLYKRAGLALPETFRFLRPRCDRVVAGVLGRISK
jgi:RNA polymerase sigma-70 factor (ECF subfamily)